ncbi:MAG TPA: purine-nucleoside phosphorylase, partial [Gemmataceae bacterium]|nr:purine-nucleoside phosphorylase [Gemmataceae bacterium]
MANATYSDLLEAIQVQPPLAGLVLGSGLNEVTDGLPCPIDVPFASLPGMPATTVAGHRGRLSLLEWDQGTLLVFQGRVHYYEGHSWNVVAQPIRLAAELGVKTLLLTNASGGIGQELCAGSLIAVRDHIAAMQPNWWRQPGLGGIAASLPSVYAPRLRSLLQRAAADIGLALPEGVYACVTGPNYETPAEVQALKKLGADAVGMSTVHEARIAAALGMEVAAISCV